MASKDKGGKHNKTPASHDLRQKRQAKKDKKAGGAVSEVQALRTRA